MAAQNRGAGASLIDALRSSPEKFEFFQAVRILERMAELSARGQRACEGARVGFDADPVGEAVLIRAALDRVFPTSEVIAYHGGAGRPELEVTVMGLVGPSGVLPGIYSAVALDAQRGKNTALRDFFDMFNHRALSFFVRAADKYRLGAIHARSARAPTDPIGAVLHALVGMGQASLRGRLPVPDETIAYYAGHYAHRPRTAGALARLLSDYFEQPAIIHQFQERWAALAPAERTRLGAHFCRLGVDAMAGGMVKDVQGVFRISLGPLDYDEFVVFLPDGPRMAELCALTRAYVGQALSFDVQLIVKGRAIPQLVLSKTSAPRLGWNTWLPTQTPRADTTDAVFRTDAI